MDLEGFDYLNLPYSLSLNRIKPWVNSLTCDKNLELWHSFFFRYLDLPRHRFMILRIRSGEGPT